MADFAVIRHYRFDPKNGAEIDKQVREGFVPIIRKAKGFIRYYWLDTGAGEGASFGLFRDKAGADESVRLAADFVKQHLSKLMVSKPEIIEGPVVAHD
jgi:quinol monooxygenase YgiN